MVLPGCSRIPVWESTEIAHRQRNPPIRCRPIPPFPEREIGLTGL